LVGIKINSQENLSLVVTQPTNTSKFEPKILAYLIIAKAQLPDTKKLKSTKLLEFVFTYAQPMLIVVI